jgi:hypothetical protein
VTLVVREQITTRGSVMNATQTSLDIQNRLTWARLNAEAYDSMMTAPVVYTTPEWDAYRYAEAHM